MERIEVSWLCDYETCDILRVASEQERKDSVNAARDDGGAGVIEVDGRLCYATGGSFRLSDVVQVWAQPSIVGVVVRIHGPNEIVIELPEDDGEGGSTQLTFSSYELKLC
jgi:hypothetical protein